MRRQRDAVNDWRTFAGDGVRNCGEGGGDDIGGLDDGDDKRFLTIFMTSKDSEFRRIQTGLCFYITGLIGFSCFPELFRSRSFLAI